MDVAFQGFWLLRCVIIVARQALLATEDVTCIDVSVQFWWWSIMHVYIIIIIINPLLSTIVKYMRHPQLTITSMTRLFHRSSDRDHVKIKVIHRLTFGRWWRWRLTWEVSRLRRCSRRRRYRWDACSSTDRQTHRQTDIETYRQTDTYFLPRNRYIAETIWTWHTHTHTHTGLGSIGTNFNDFEWA